jgi:phage tail sheath protein FI
MAFSVSPSVIVREVDASAAVPAIATPPAAIAGVFRWGPVGETILVSSENELVNRFGKPTNDNYETFFVAADYLSYANALYVARVDNGAVKASAEELQYHANGDINDTFTRHGAFEAKYPGSLGNSLEVGYVKDTSFEQEILNVGDIPASTITVDVNGATSSVTIEYNANTVLFELAPSNAIGATAMTAGDILTIGNDSVGYQDIEVSSFVERTVNSDGDTTANTSLIAAHEYTIGLGTKYKFFENSLNKLKLEKKWKDHTSFRKAPQTGNYHVIVKDKVGTISGTPGTILELYEDVSTTSTAKLADGSTNYYADVILGQSDWVQVANTTHFANTTYSTSSYEAFGVPSDAVTTNNANTSLTAITSTTIGTDGTTESATSLGALAGGYDLFANSNEIDVSFVLQGKGDNSGNLANYIISNIADYRKDAVAFISPSKEAVVDENKTNTKLANVIAYAENLQNSSYSFMDSGYKYRYDKYNDVYRYVPLNGDTAGLASRVEPFESPAGFRKGVIKNVVKLAFNPNKAQRDQLYSKDINPVMSQVGQGIVLFGDKTGLGLPSAFDRLNVRRLFISVEKAIANAAQSFLFELNDEFSQTQFKNIVEPFLREIQGRRGIIDFRVISDGTVNTPAVVDQGKFKANIFIKPARSINVIELTFVATRSGIEFEEIVGSIG